MGSQFYSFLAITGINGNDSLACKETNGAVIQLLMLDEKIKEYDYQTCPVLKNGLGYVS